MKMRKAFNFFRSYFEVYKKLNDKDKVAFIDALLMKQFHDIEPELEGMAEFAYLSQKHNIDQQVQGYKDKTKKELDNPSEPPSVGGRQGGKEGPSVQGKGKEKDNIDMSSSDELDLSAKYDLTLAYLNKKTNRKRRKCAKSFARFKQRLKDGYTGKDFQKAIDNAVLDDHHKDNDYKWLTMEFITRQDKLEYLINLETKPNKIDYNKYLQ